MKLFIAACVLSVAMGLCVCGAATAETVHQTVASGSIYTGDGGNAVIKGLMETKKVEGADNGQVARIKGDMPQWGFVNCWFGVPTPAGKSVVRMHVYYEGQQTAKYLLYTSDKSGQHMIGELKMPADAKSNTFVTIDVAVNAPEEWSGLVIKKADTSDLPSPWIDTVSTVLPD